MLFSATCLMCGRIRRQRRPRKVFTNGGQPSPPS